LSPIYTHDFDFKLGEDFRMKGECEFNVDGQASFRTESALQNMTAEQNHRISILFNLLREIFKDFEGIRVIKITKK